MNGRGVLPGAGRACSPAPGRVYLINRLESASERRLFFLAPAPGFPALSFFPGRLPRWPRAHGKGIHIALCSGYSPATLGAGQASTRTSREHPKKALSSWRYLLG